MKNQTWKAAVSAAAIAAGAIIPFAANADTVTTNGVTWTYIVTDAENKTVTLGGVGTFDTAAPSGGVTDEMRAMPKATQIDASLIPWTFKVGDDTYTVTALGSLAFYGCTGLTGLLCIPSSVTTFGRESLYSTNVRLISFPGVTTMYGYAFQKSQAQPFPDISSVTTFGRGVFYNCPFSGTVRFGKDAAVGSYRLFRGCSNLEAIYAPGPDSSSKSFNVDEFAYGDKKLKVVFFGPNTKPSNATKGTMLTSVSNCKVFVPANGQWDALVTGGTDNEVIYYGASTNVNFAVDDDAGLVVATPTTEAALAKALDSAPLFKTHFGWDMKISTTNAIAVTAGTITAAKFKDAGIGASSLMLNFAVTNQAQLDSILGAVPSGAKVGIDPTGLTENMVVEDRENVFVKNVPGVTIRRRANGGFAILVL